MTENIAGEHRGVIVMMTGHLIEGGNVKGSKIDTEDDIEVMMMMMMIGMVEMMIEKVTEEEEEIINLKKDDDETHHQMTRRNIRGVSAALQRNKIRVMGLAEEQKKEQNKEQERKMIKQKRLQHLLRKREILTTLF